MKRFYFIALFLLSVTMAGITASAQDKPIPETFADILIANHCVFWKTDQDGSHIYYFDEENDLQTWDVPEECTKAGQTRGGIVAITTAGDRLTLHTDTGEIEREAAEEKKDSQDLPDGAQIYMDRDTFRIYYDPKDDVQIGEYSWQVAHHYYLVSSDGAVKDLGQLNEIYSYYAAHVESPAIWVDGSSGLRVLDQEGNEQQIISEGEGVDEFSILEYSEDDSFVVWDETTETTHSLYVWNHGEKHPVGQVDEKSDLSAFSRAYLCDQGKKVLIWNIQDDQIYIYDLLTDSVMPVELPFHSTPSLNPPLFAPSYFYSKDLPWSDFYLLGEDPDYFLCHLFYIDTEGNAEMVVDKIDIMDYPFPSSDSIYYRYNNCLYRAPGKGEAYAQPEEISKNASYSYILNLQGNALFYLTNYSNDTKKGTLNVYWADSRTSEEIDTDLEMHQYYPLGDGESLLYKKDRVPVSGDALDQASDSTSVLMKADLYLYRRGQLPERIGTDVLDVLQIYDCPYSINSGYLKDKEFYYTTYVSTGENGENIVDLHYYNEGEDIVAAERVIKS